MIMICGYIESSLMITTADQEFKNRKFERPTLVTVLGSYKYFGFENSNWRCSASNGKRLIELTLIDQRRLPSHVCPEEFASELIEKLYCFCIQLTPQRSSPRKLLGEANELTRLIERFDYVYSYGRLKSITVRFATGLEYPMIVGRAFEKPHNDVFTVETGLMLLEKRRALMDFYIERCSTQIPFVISYDPTNAGQHLRSYLVGTRRSWVVLERWKFASADPHRWCVNLEAFHFVGAHKTLQTQINRAKQYAPPSAKILIGPANHVLDHTNYARSLCAGHYTKAEREAAEKALWKPLPYYDRRFYSLFAHLVSVVAVLSSLSLPPYVIDEIIMFARIGTYLLEKSRIKAIASTLASCRAIRGARESRVAQVKLM